MSKFLLFSVFSMASALRLPPPVAHLSGTQSEMALDAASDMAVAGNTFDFRENLGLEGWQNHASEQAIFEAGLSTDQVSAFGKSVVKFPKSLVEQLLQLKNNTKHTHKYNFMGRVSGQNWGVEEKARQWAIDFAKEKFTKDDIFVVTHLSPDWKALGAFDKSKEMPRRESHSFAKIGSSKLDVDMTYWQQLMSSDFTLCPGGDDHFSYRGYETALAGSVCVIKSVDADWTPTKTSHPGNGLTVNPKMKPLEKVFNLLKTVSADEPHDSVAAKSVADQNFKTFIKYLTFIEGDNTPPEN